MNSAPFYNQAKRNWILKALVFSLSGTLSAALAGMVLGLVGGVIPFNVRVAIASIFALLGLAIGLVELIRPRFTPLQCNRETPQQWLFRGPLFWAFQNGATLGLGATTRIGFWLWYVVPIGALLVGQPLVSALIFGLYGSTRNGCVWARLLGPARRYETHDIDMWLLGSNESIKRLTSALLVVVCTALAVVLGF